MARLLSSATDAEGCTVARLLILSLNHFKLKMKTMSIDPWGPGARAVAIIVIWVGARHWFGPQYEHQRVK